MYVYIYTTEEIEECCITNFEMAFALTKEKDLMLHGCIIVPPFLLGTLQHKTWDGAQMFFQRLSDKSDFQAAVNYL